MKKVALLTWNTYENYGTFLQWYALTKELLNLDCDVKSINYVPRLTPQSDILPNSRLSVFNHYLNVAKNRLKNRAVLLSDAELKERHEKFLQFKEEPVFKFTNLCETSSDFFSLNKDFDYFICGSDQIWRPLCFDAHYFLDFVEDRNKKIAYAPSIGSSKVKNPFIKNKMFSLIKDFAHLSIRENAGKKLIEENCGIDVPVVLDPTLLLSSDEWIKAENKEYQTSKKYMLCYFLGNNESYWKQIENLSNKMQIPLVVLPVYKNDFSRSSDVPKNVGPKEFLTLVENASFVCTDSFHCSIFSFLFHKEFAIFPRFKKSDFRNQNSRIESFAETFGFKNRVVSKKNPLENIYKAEIDFLFSDEKLNSERKKSIDYLKNALNAEEKLEKIKFEVTNTCCGCGACAAVCTKNAVTVKRNENGFLKSFVDENKCVKCLRCRSVCPFYQKNYIEPITNKNLLYAVKSKDKKVLNVSSSGGIGYELMNHFKSNSESVTGCVYDKENIGAKGVTVEPNDFDSFDFSRFQGSKYIQSDYSEVFKNLKNIEGGIITGLPCQIAAANNYLNLIGKRNEFFLVDLVCHGVPTQNLWEKYIAEKTKIFRFKEKPDVKFRYKPLGWAQRFICLSSKNKQININSKKDLFYAFFLEGNCYADSCYECKYRCSSCADLRIADYWGSKFQKDKTGVSMCIALTANGENILFALKKQNKIYCELSDIQDLFKWQQTKNTFVPLERDCVIEDLKSSKNLKIIRNEWLRASKTRSFVMKIMKPITVLKNIIRK